MPTLYIYRFILMLLVLLFPVPGKRKRIKYISIVQPTCTINMICLWVFFSYRDVTIAGEELQMLTYARHSWPLSSEGSLARHGAYVYNDHL